MLEQPGRGLPDDPTSWLGWGDLTDVERSAAEPREKVSPYVFARDHRVYTKEGRSSRYRPEETPWAARIFWALSAECPKRRVIMPKGTQIGATEIGLIKTGSAALAGESGLLIFPTEAVAKRAVRTKFRPMLQSTTILAGLFPGRAADTTLHFSAPSVDLMFAGSNSPTNFAMVSVQWAMGDEIDRWSPELLDEGDPVDLLENRIAEYGFLGKLFLPCSPTVEGASLVWREWLSSDQEYYECPCPKCGALQSWHWDMLSWTPGDHTTVVMICRHCQQGSPEHAWKAIWGEGAWRATVEKPARSDTLGFHLSTLYARPGQRSWAQLVQLFEAVMESGLPARLQVFHNTILGLPWKITEDAVPVETLRERLEDLEQGVVPAGGLVLTAGVDYQKNRIELFIWAWGRGRERWLVDKVVIERLDREGQKRPSAALAADMKAMALDKVWPHAHGGGLTVEMSLHDSGDLPGDVFDLLDHLKTRQALASKGREGWGEAQNFRTPKIVDVYRNGKVVATGRRLMTINTAPAKAEWYEDLRRALSEEAGGSERYVHLGAWIDDEKGLLEQFVAEEVRKSSRGKLHWVKITERNEGLDCAILADGARWQLKTHRWSAAEWLRREAMVSVDASPTPTTPAPAAAGGNRRIRGRMT